MGSTDWNRIISPPNLDRKSRRKKKRIPFSEAGNRELPVFPFHPHRPPFPQRDLTRHQIESSHHPSRKKKRRGGKERGREGVRMGAPRGMRRRRRPPQRQRGRAAGQVRREGSERRLGLAAAASLPGEILPSAEGWGFLLPCPERSESQTKERRAVLGDFFSKL